MKFEKENLDLVEGEEGQRRKVEIRGGSCGVATAEIEEAVGYRDKGLEAADGGHERAAGLPFLVEILGGSCGVADD
ncbi:hypothetical protein SLEP1_g21032 [Rubroshorea leprosula]|uniref:Uncharacterized protein n=1 Tax=Rubroshorea leprosula TaxID=152421 RepID=A0AAV5J4L5_9ROSI|nr:hypothetical protein SLEP1_g21032 [Rubroshorea leprosula]